MSELLSQHEGWKAAHARLWGRPTAETARAKSPTLFVEQSRRGLPRNGTTLHHRKERKAVDFAFAMGLVCDDRGISANQILNSPYCAAVAARHMLWTVLFDGGYAHADIARRFAVDHSTVRLGIASFREFHAETVKA